jgi:hypothetical protein
MRPACERPTSAPGLIDHKEERSWQKLHARAHTSKQQTHKPATHRHAQAIVTTRQPAAKLSRAWMSSSCACISRCSSALRLPTPSPPPGPTTRAGRRSRPVRPEAVASAARAPARMLGDAAKGGATAADEADSSCLHTEMALVLMRMCVLTKLPLWCFCSRRARPSLPWSC